MAPVGVLWPNLHSLASTTLYHTSGRFLLEEANPPPRRAGMSPPLHSTGWIEEAFLIGPSSTACGLPLLRGSPTAVTT